MTAGPEAQVPSQPDDTSIGLEMFVVFTAAILIVTGGVVLLALINSWWMLGAAFAVHVGMTAVVTATIAYAMSGRTFAAGRPGGEQERADQRSDTRSSRKAVSAHP